MRKSIVCGDLLPFTLDAWRGSSATLWVKLSMRVTGTGSHTHQRSVGTRDYYRRMGYELDTQGQGQFMIKELSADAAHHRVHPTGLAVPPICPRCSRSPTPACSRAWLQPCVIAARLMMLHVLSWPFSHAPDDKRRSKSQASADGQRSAAGAEVAKGTAIRGAGAEPDHGPSVTASEQCGSATDAGPISHLPMRTAAVVVAAVACALFVWSRRRPTL